MANFARVRVSIAAAAVGGVRMVTAVCKVPTGVRLKCHRHSRPNSQVMFENQTVSNEWKCFSLCQVTQGSLGSDKAFWAPDSAYNYMYNDRSYPYKCSGSKWKKEPSKAQLCPKQRCVTGESPMHYANMVEYDQNRHGGEDLVGAAVDWKQTFAHNDRKYGPLVVKELPGTRCGKKGFPTCNFYEFMCNPKAAGGPNNYVVDHTLGNWQHSRHTAYGYVGCVAGDWYVLSSNNGNKGKPKKIRSKNGTIFPRSFCEDRQSHQKKEV